MITVVIPAHNEGLVLNETLECLTDGAPPGALDVVVVCNGCDDDSFAIASDFGPPVRAVQIPVPSKVEALNVGDATVDGFPRFYLDADVQLDFDALTELAAALDRGDGLIAFPRLSLDASRSSAAVRSYYRFWSLLPSVREQPVGRGVFGLTGAARARFQRFPDVIADDAYVRSLFPVEDQVHVDSCCSRVRTPHRLAGVVSRRTRVHAGNQQLEGLGVSSGGGGGQWRRVIAEHPVRIVDLPAFLTVAVRARCLAARDRRAGVVGRWRTDDTRLPNGT